MDSESVWNTRGRRFGAERSGLAATVAAVVVAAGVVGASVAAFSDAGVSSTLVGATDGIAAHSMHSDCISCHRFNAALSHPVSVRPNTAIPSQFPLVDGRISCVTCHDVGSSETPMLRGGASGASFCAACHQGSSADRQAAHGQGLARAHLPTSRETHAVAGHILDTESQQCMACHDGISAGDSGSHAAKSGRLLANRDHPIGVKLTSKPTDRSSDEIRLVNASGLDPRIRLFNDTVGCGSCHSVYSRLDDLLVVSNHQSQLCLKCHIE